MSEQMIRVLLVDDHTLVREGLMALLADKPGIQVVGEASDAGSGIALAKDLRPDVVLMDVSMPGTSGIEATQAITSEVPGVHVVGLTVHENAEYLSRMLAAGASGYVLKGATSAQLLEAIRTAWLGGVYLSAGIATFVEQAVRRNLEPASQNIENGLTTRERKVLELLAAGLSNPEIAAEMQLSVSTVQSYRSNIMRKLHLDSSRQLVLYAIQRRNRPD